MRAPLALLLLAALAPARPADPHNATTTLGDIILHTNDTVLISNDTVFVGNQTFVLSDNDTLIETDSEHEPIVRKKRTFGDLVFRGLADVLGYSVQRKPPVFPPPLAPVPGIDLPVQAAAGPAPPPCGTPRAAPPPCRPPPPPPPPPKPRPPPPCPRPRAAPPKRPPPPPPPPPPCPKPRANPATPAPCGPPPPPPPKDNVDTITSSLRFSFNINRERPTAPPPADEAEVAAPIAIEPRAARLPLEEPRKPRVYVDAFVLRDGVPQRVNTVDAANLNQQAPDDYLAYDDDDQRQQEVDDDYEDVQESRDKAVKEFGSAVNKFWEKKRKPSKKFEGPADYRSVHFGDRNFNPQLRRRSDTHQSLQSANDVDDESESITTTEDPRKPLRPKVLPPTEHNPGQIDTVTVRVPPIYREKRPKKLNRAPDRDDSEERDDGYGESDESDSEGENTVPEEQTARPRRRRRKQRRRIARSTRGAAEDDPFAAVDYDYFGRKLPVSAEENFYRQLRLPDPTPDPDVERVEKTSKQKDPYFLDDHERLREDPERVEEDERLDDSGRSDDSGHTDDSGRTDDSGHTDDSGRTHDKERLVEDPERTDETQRADSSERTDALSPSAHLRETGFHRHYLHATDTRQHDPRPKKRRS